jgi:hypothetical protein
LFRYAELAAICVLVQIDDSVPSNKRVFKTIESSSPDNLLPIRVRCNSHQACLVVIPFTVWCNFLNPLFCNTKHLHISSNFEKALKSLREVLARRAKRITGRMPPRACAGDWALLLEVLYYSVDLVEVSGDASAEYLDAIRESDKTRRAFGATVVGMFTGDPSDLVGDVVHHCSGVSCGFCGGTDETFHVKAFEISKELFFPHNQVPSMTKWKSCCPLCRRRLAATSCMVSELILGAACAVATTMAAMTSTHPATTLISPMSFTATLLNTVNHDGNALCLSTPTRAWRQRCTYIAPSPTSCTTYIILCSSIRSLRTHLHWMPFHRLFGFAVATRCRC